MEQEEYQDLLEKYKERVKEEFGEASTIPSKVTTKEYSEFKAELYPNHYSLYEKACNFSDNLLKLKVDEVKAIKIQKNLDLTHLNVRPAGVIALSYLLPMAVMVLGSLIAFSIFQMMFFVFFFLIAGMLMIPALQKIPEFMGNTWRMKASNQMVQSIFYLVTYMRHTSNFERAIEFAADHLEPPLSLDFRKIMWDVETERYSTIRESADAYLQVWKEWDKEFVESFHLVESSLFESTEERRLSLLDKALDVILNGTYENMMHYAHSLKSPMTMLHMLGVILPILGLVILPLVVSFMGGDGTSPFVSAIYISVLYNISLPLGVYYLGRTILSKRPAGYGAIDIGEKPGLKKFRNVNINIGKSFVLSVNPLYFSIMIFAVGMLIGFSPLIMHSLNAPDFAFDEKGNMKMLDYVCPPDKGIECAEEDKLGPYGLGSSILSLVVIASLGGSIGLFYALRSKNVIKIRQKTKELEDEFSSALFQLGNRLGDGLPAEIAFSRVAATMRGTVSGDFFNLTEKNITKLGMGLEQAIFDQKVGALVSFPSKVIESSMKVLIESIRKGPRIAAQSLLSMSRYIKEIHRVEERLNDLMADVISSMKSQVKFLTPAIAGIVIGITSMISTILTKLSSQLGAFTASGQAGGAGGFEDMLSIFGIGIPTFHFQIVVGIYIVQIAYILTVLSNGVENGADKLGERYALGKDLTRSTLLYCFLAAVVMILFNLFAGTIMQRTLVG
ncbi:MAG: hypothetical protein KKA62_02335 [Nanoarchaeota archaeon]|nr:hypothetical protein [Nanoarchaeota archaeon]MBU1643673.1 hypothetical protein [Nanoarchaeota archaeon]MBU1976771.1 hypothetical protein [Nanoarchaeota archaeon]